MTHGATKSLDGRLVRRNYGKGHGYIIDGQKADGVTGILNDSIPKPALVSWAAGAVGQFFADDPEAALSDLKRYGEEGFVEAMKKIPNKERDLAANKGTAVHDLAEKIAKGEEVTVEDYLSGHVDSYLAYRDIVQPTDEMIEVSCFNVQYRFGGTLDAWAHLEVLKKIIDPRTGKPFCTCSHKCLSLVDLKTNRSGPFGEVGLQLAGYSKCEFYIDAAGQIREMPKFDHFFALWIRSDGFDLIPYYVTEKDQKTFLYCQQVARFNNWKTGRVSQIKGAALELPKREG